MARPFAPPITREEAANYVKTGDGLPYYQGRRLEYARAVVALHDEVERLKTDLRLTQNSEVACIGELGEKDGEIVTLTASLRLAEASVSLLRADLEQTTTAWAQECAESLRRADERDAARLELRRLRAAEAPGTDDAAFEGTGWAFHPAGWRHASGAVVLSHDAQWRITGSAPHPHTIHDVALDAMRAAVPGSV